MRWRPQRGGVPFGLPFKPTLKVYQLNKHAHTHTTKSGEAINPQARETYLRHPQALQLNGTDTVVQKSNAQRTNQTKERLPISGNSPHDDFGIARKAPHTKHATSKSQLRRPNGGSIQLGTRPGLPWTAFKGMSKTRRSNAKRHLWLNQCWNRTCLVKKVTQLVPMLQPNWPAGGKWCISFVPRPTLLCRVSSSRVELLPTENRCLQKPPERRSPQRGPHVAVGFLAWPVERSGYGCVCV